MLKLDGTVKIEKMQYLLTSLNEIKEDDRELIVTRMVVIANVEAARHGSVTAVLALQHSSASMQYKSTDDLLSILPKDLSEGIFITEFDL